MTSASLYHVCGQMATSQGENFLVAVASVCSSQRLTFVGENGLLYPVGSLQCLHENIKQIAEL